MLSQKERKIVHDIIREKLADVAKGITAHARAERIAAHYLDSPQAEGALDRADLYFKAAAHCRSTNAFLEEIEEQQHGRD